MSALAEWQTFLAVQAGAAATLTGLVFVAVSINLAHIMKGIGLPGRAAESLLQLLQVFFISSIMLVPRQATPVLGGEVLTIAILSWTAQTISQIRYGKSRMGHPWSWLLTRIIMSQFATVPFCIAGVLFYLDNPAGTYWLVPGFALSFVAAVMSAWVLLVEILR